jgi:hypothetical protein
LQAKDCISVLKPRLSQAPGMAGPQSKKHANHELGDIQISTAL